MAIQNQNQFNSNTNRIYRDQLLTVEDLNQFRAQLLNDIRNLLNSNPNNLNQSKQWLKSNEVCKLLGISPNTLNKFRINGSLKPKKIGRLVYYNMEEISKMLNQ